MYSPAQLGFKYLHYFLTASNSRGHGMHSPFVFEFITQVLNDKTKYPAYKQVEGLRNRLLKDETVLVINDPGAGSVASNESRRTIASVAKNAAKSKKFGQLLYRIVKKYQPRTIVELGTSLGITTSYLSLAAPGAKVITMEGAKAVAAAARNNFKDTGLQNISLIEGNFDDILSQTLSGLESIDLCFIDGNHRREPTLRYFEQILSKVHNNTILVFDDIHWSREMEEAWQLVKAQQAVRCSIDLFFIGIVFFRREFKEKQDFVIRF